MSYCGWDSHYAPLIAYHDEEWGVPVHDDGKQFEFLMMEVMQCGLNWRMMLAKREVFRECFAGFDYDAVAQYGEKDVERILSTPNMIRSVRKVEAVITDARCFQKIREEYGSFSQYLWNHTDGNIVLYNKHADGYIPVSNGLSDAISGDLKRRGFKYLGTITIYSHLQACGIINDHARDCPRRAQILAAHPWVERRRRLEKNVSYYGD